LARLIYSAIMSLDGYIADESGNFDWAAPDEEVHRFVNELERPIGTYLYGRRMYETMVYWETEGDDSDVTRDFATMWRAADKVVYSRTLQATSSARTRVERDFDVASVRAMKGAAGKDMTVAGAELARQALEAGLVDELQLFLAPVLVGGGKKGLPDRVFARLALLDERRFASGTMYVRYAIDGSAKPLTDGSGAGV
jgi:dihydrofolate reductase